MPKLTTSKDNQPTCFYCKKTIKNIKLAFWVLGHPHDTVGCANETRKKMPKVNRWKQLHSFKSAG